MADNRRTPARGSRPSGRSGPGRGSAAGSTGRSGRGAATSRPRDAAGKGPAKAPAKASAKASARAKASAATQPTSRPRLTGRAAILVLVVAVLVVSYASSMRAYLQQRSHIDDLQARISDKEASIDDLERERQRWEDPEYVRAQARARLGYVMPGETPFVVLREGEPLESESTLTDPDSLVQEPPPAWYGDVWDSMKVAGTPPRTTRPPLIEIDGADETEQD